MDIWELRWSKESSSAKTIKMSWGETIADFTGSFEYARCGLHWNPWRPSGGGRGGRRMKHAASQWLLQVACGVFQIHSWQRRFSLISFFVSARRGRLAYCLADHFAADCSLLHRNGHPTLLSHVIHIIGGCRTSQPWDLGFRLGQKD